MGQCATSRKQSRMQTRKTATLNQCIIEVPVKSVYSFKKVIGGGSFGVVRLAESIKDPSRKFAIKTVKKSKLSAERIRNLKRETEFLCKLDHPNIIKFYEIYENSYSFDIVMEYCSGGALYDKIVDKGKFSESEARMLMRKMLLAVSHLHSMHIVHRDLKPDNFVFESDHPEAEIKLVDFGLSNRYADVTEQLHSIVGTASYVAPEVLDENYSDKCDLWSLGVILYGMLSGNLPFYDNNSAGILNKIQKGSFRFEKKYWQHVSYSAKDLVMKLIVKDPAVRLSATQALAHNWFQDILRESHCFNQEVLSSLQEFNKASDFKKRALNVLVRQLSPTQIQEVKDMFLELDSDQSGYISVQNLSDALSSIGMNLLKDEIQELINSIGMQSDGKLHYTDFLTAAMYSKLHIIEEDLYHSFLSFDIDKSGRITRENLKTVFTKYVDMEEEKLERIIEEACSEEDNGITYSQFKQIIESNL